MAGKEGVNAEFMVNFLENSIAQILQADLQLADLGRRIQFETDRFRFKRFLGRFLLGNFAEVGDRIGVEFLQVVQIPNCFDVFLLDFAIFAITMCKSQKNAPVFAAVFLDVHGSTILSLRL